MTVAVTTYRLLEYAPVPVELAAQHLPRYADAVAANSTLRRHPAIAAMLLDAPVVQGGSLHRDDRVAGELLAVAADPVADLERWEMYLVERPDVAVALARQPGLDPHWIEVLGTVIDTPDTPPMCRRELGAAFDTNPALGGLHGTRWRHSDLAHRCAVGPSDVTLDDAVTHTIDIAGFAAWVHLARRRPDEVVGALAARGDGITHHATAGAAAAVVARWCPPVADDATAIAEHYQETLAGVADAAWRWRGRTALRLLRPHDPRHDPTVDAVAALVDGDPGHLWSPPPAASRDVPVPHDIAALAAVCGNSATRWRLALELADTVAADAIADTVAAV